MSKKRRKDWFERDLKEIYDVGDMLHDEGASSSESRYKVIVAEQLLMLNFTLESIRTPLFILLGLIAVKVLTGLF